MTRHTNDAFCANDLAQVLFSARISADGRLHAVGGLDAKFRALIADTRVIRIHTLVCSRAQDLGADWQRFRLPGHGLRLIEAHTLSEAMAILAERLRERADPAFAGLRQTLPLPAADTRIDRPMLEQALEQAIRDLAAQAPAQRLPRGYVVIEGEAGTGKSALLAQYVAHEEARGLERQLVAAHFIRRGDAGRDDPHVFLQTLARQVRLRRAQGDTETAPEGAADFLQSLHEAVEGLTAPLIIVIDALDEAFGSSGTSPLRHLAPFLPDGDRLPDGVILVVSTRPGEPYLRTFPRGPCARVMIGGEAAQNDVLRYIHAMNERHALAIEPALRNEMARRVQGNFELVSLLFRGASAREPVTVARWHATLDHWRAHPASLPTSLQEFLQREWDRMLEALAEQAPKLGFLPVEAESAATAILGLLRCTQSPLTRTQLQALANALHEPAAGRPGVSPVTVLGQARNPQRWFDQILPVLDLARTFLHQEEGRGCRLANATVEEFVAAQLRARGWEPALHQVLGFACTFYAQPPKSIEALADYAVFTLAKHLHLGGRNAAATEVLCDPVYLQALADRCPDESALLTAVLPTFMGLLRAADQRQHRRLELVSTSLTKHAVQWVSGRLKVAATLFNELGGLEPPGGPWRSRLLAAARQGGGLLRFPPRDPGPFTPAPFADGAGFSSDGRLCIRWEDDMIVACTVTERNLVWGPAQGWFVVPKQPRADRQLLAQRPGTEVIANDLSAENTDDDEGPWSLCAVEISETHAWGYILCYVRRDGGIGFVQLSPSAETAQHLGELAYPFPPDAALELGRALVSLSPFTNENRIAAVIRPRSTEGGWSDRIAVVELAVPAPPGNAAPSIVWEGPLAEGDRYLGGPDQIDFPLPTPIVFADPLQAWLLGTRVDHDTVAVHALHASGKPSLYRHVTVPGLPDETKRNRENHNIEGFSIATSPNASRLEVRVSIRVEGTAVFSIDVASGIESPDTADIIMDPSARLLACKTIRQHDHPGNRTYSAAATREGLRVATTRNRQGPLQIHDLPWPERWQYFSWPHESDGGLELLTRASMLYIATPGPDSTLLHIHCTIKPDGSLAAPEWQRLRLPPDLDFHDTMRLLRTPADQVLAFFMKRGGSETPFVATLEDLPVLEPDGPATLDTGHNAGADPLEEAFIGNPGPFPRSGDRAASCAGDSGDDLQCDHVRLYPGPIQARIDTGDHGWFVVTEATEDELAVHVQREDAPEIQTQRIRFRLDALCSGSSEEIGCYTSTSSDARHLIVIGGDTGSRFALFKAAPQPTLEQSETAAGPILGLGFLDPVAPGFVHCLIRTRGIDREFAFEGSLLPRVRSPITLLCIDVAGPIPRIDSRTDLGWIEHSGPSLAVLTVRHSSSGAPAIVAVTLDTSDQRWLTLCQLPEDPRFPAQVSRAAFPNAIPGRPVSAAHASRICREDCWTIFLEIEWMDGTGRTLAYVNLQEATAETPIWRFAAGDLVLSEERIDLYPGKYGTGVIAYATPTHGIQVAIMEHDRMVVRQMPDLNYVSSCGPFQDHPALRFEALRFHPQVGGFEAVHEDLVASKSLTSWILLNEADADRPPTSGQSRP